MTTFSAITDGVKVSVQSEFQDEYSKISKQNFVFTYRVTIENQSNYTIKLLRRHWFIYDSLGQASEVEGEGVIGLQPVLAMGEAHEYTSGCHLHSTMGKMKGTYLMERLIDGALFTVTIPEFTLIAPFQLN
ncbi:MAG: Co2+/Mg2+ efflux protein ApaG [Cytophagales bacterium]|nr:MAG: Co2+/Mg2+ efflux protein ApaG [Cytophagales bacterium]TAF61459.1 MAG: Co2+/Mg2+ efflux protein ApaG [Cytophagales bacterium]